MIPGIVSGDQGATLLCSVIVASEILGNQFDVNNVNGRLLILTEEKAWISQTA